MAGQSVAEDDTFNKDSPHYSLWYIGSQHYGCLAFKGQESVLIQVIASWRGGYKPSTWSLSRKIAQRDKSEILIWHFELHTMKETKISKISRPAISDRTSPVGRQANAYSPAGDCWGGWQIDPRVRSAAKDGTLV